MRTLKCVIFCLGLVVAQERSKYADKTADVASINNLAYKSPLTLDPKIRKALLKVLNRLEEQDKKKPPPDSKITAKVSSFYQLAPSTTTENPTSTSDEIKWEYKTNNDTFQVYDFYSFITSTSSSLTNRTEDAKNANDDDDDDERGALFFQIPEKQERIPITNYEEKLHHVKSEHVRSGLNEPAPTKNTLPGSNIVFANLQNQINKENLPTTEIPTTTTSPAPVLAPINETDSKPETNETNAVEFFRAPLLTAFTLEQDARGLPQRIIPLEVPDSELRVILRNGINLDLRGNRGAIAEQKVQQTQHTSAPAQPPVTSNFFRKPDLQTQENVTPLNLFRDESQRIRLELESQYQQLQERKRQIEFEKEQLLAEQAKAIRLKFDLKQQQREQEYARALNQNEIIKSEIAFQKSIEPQIGHYGLVPAPRSTVGVHQFNARPFENPAFVNHHRFQHFPAASEINLQQVNLPGIVDRQLQNLFQQYGLNPRGQQEDLNIVSKVLALNHEPSNEVRRVEPRINSNIQTQSQSAESRSENSVSLAASTPSTIPPTIGGQNVIF